MIMRWNDWYPFNEENIRKHAPAEEGIYRIKLSEGNCFVLGPLGWELCTAEPSLIKAFNSNEPLRVYSCKRGNKVSICTDLVYIGSTENQNLQTRLRQHLSNSSGSPCIQELLNMGYQLFFSFLSRASDAYEAERNLYRRFIEATRGYCPPCDRNSRECQAERGR